MSRFRSRFIRPVRDRGASAVEYGLMVAAIAAVIVGVVFLLSEGFIGGMQDTCRGFEAHNNMTDPDDNC